MKSTNMNRVDDKLSINFGNLFDKNLKIYIFFNKMCLLSYSV